VRSIRKTHHGLERKSFISLRICKSILLLFWLLVILTNFSVKRPRESSGSKDKKFYHMHQKKTNIIFRQPNKSFLPWMDLQVQTNSKEISVSNKIEIVSQYNLHLQFENKVILVLLNLGLKLIAEICMQVVIIYKKGVV